MSFRRRSLGFTMLELSVTIGLVVLLLTLSSISYRRANKRTEIILTAQELASTLRLAENYAASAKTVENNPDYNIWGLYFDKTDNRKITMFVDKNKNGLYDGETEKYKVINLPQQIRVDKLLYDARNDSTVNQVSITFVPPDPKVRMCSHSSGNCTNAWITDPVANPKFNSESWTNFYLILADDLNNSSKDVNVNFFGMIDTR